jgi:integrase/recombinase XerD
MQKSIRTLQEGKEEFIVDCKIRNLSATTIKSYEECFDYFIQYVESQFENINIYNDINKITLDNYIINMQENNLKDTTINIRLRSIRCVLYYFMKNGYIEQFKINQIKENEKIPELYTDKEIEKLLKKPNLKKCTFAEYRTWAIINFFVATGVRSRSLRNIKIQDLDFDNDLIYVRVTKNRKLLIIPMGKAIKKVLFEYLKVRGGEKEDYLFCNLEGEQLTKNALNNIISKYNRKRGVERTGIHLFRHYFAKNYIQNGGNALKLQKILGHSTLEETQRYVDLFGQDLQKDFDNFSPLDKICNYKERIKISR